MMRLLTKIVQAILDGFKNKDVRENEKCKCLEFTEFLDRFHSRNGVA